MFNRAQKEGMKEDMLVHPNSLLRLMERRRSIRKYLQLPVEWDKVGRMLDAARLAPSAGNLQDWKFITVTNAEARKELADACFQQLWMNTAPLFIVVCADPGRAERMYGEKGKAYSVQDCAIATANLIMMAEAEGLATCWVGAHDDAMVRRALEIPDDVYVHAIITVGYPDEKVPVPHKFSVADITFLEKWNQRASNIGELSGEYSHYVKEYLMSAKKFAENVLERLRKV